MKIEHLLNDCPLFFRREKKFMVREYFNTELSPLNKQSHYDYWVKASGHANGPIKACEQNWSKELTTVQTDGQL